MHDGAKHKTLLSQVADYYSAKLAEYGQTPQGVDWNRAEGQQLRFAQLTKIILTEGLFSVNDLGCGYGALYDYLSARHASFNYVGCDISQQMIAAAIERHRGRGNVRYLVSAEPPETADYGIASGIFNVRFDRSDLEWREYLERTLDVLDRTSRFGFAFNCLTSYSDADKMRGNLYYADPCLLFDYCMKKHSRNVALLHDYGLYEFTLLVRKNL